MTILCYHTVQPDWDSPLAAEPAAFASQAAYLARHRAVVPLREALPRLDRTGRLPRRMAALTFDDGFETLYEYVLPVLKRHELPSTVFLVAQTLTEKGQPVDWVDTPGTGPLTTLTRDQVLEMQDAGVEFESHSYAHRTLPSLAFDECVDDLRESREFLSDLLGRHVDLLAYPRGRHDEQVRAAAAAAGYAYAFALPEEREQVGRYSIPRVGIYRRNSMAVMRIKSTRPYLGARLDPRLIRARQSVRALVGTVRARC